MEGQFYHPRLLAVRHHLSANFHALGIQIVVILKFLTHVIPMKLNARIVPTLWRRHVSVVREGSRTFLASRTLFLAELNAARSSPVVLTIAIKSATPVEAAMSLVSNSVERLNLVDIPA